VEQLAAVLPDRQVCFCRELTKLHEEVLLLPVAELVKNLQARERIRGEVVLVIGPGEPARMEAEEGPVGSRLKEVAAALAERWGCSKKEAYEQLLSLEKTRFGD
jgi:16S rRNA (cytidine1402-2'-O)-methyltransferase